MFRVPWLDDKGEVQVNRGFRIEFNSAIGPYKGGLRFHPTVNLSILKFLAFEQIFKNSLTTLPMGGGKGGSDFDPKGKSDNEVMRFCQSFMTELQRHIGPDTDVPAGDIGVGGREIGFMFGQYKRLRNEFTGVLTGKGLNWGGSLIRPEATGYGAVYFAEEMLATRGETLQGQDLPGLRLRQRRPVHRREAHRARRQGRHLSDSAGTIYDQDGIDREKLAFVMELKNVKRGRIREYADEVRRRMYRRQARAAPVWASSATAPSPAPRRTRSTATTPRPCVKNGCNVVSEGANMPTDARGRRTCSWTRNPVRPRQGRQRRRRGHLRPGDGQNAMHLNWTREEVDAAPARHHEVHPPAVRATPPRNTACRATTSSAPTSPASSRSPTPMLDQGLV